MSSFLNCTALLLFPDNSLHMKLQAFKNELFFQSFPFLVLFYYTKMQGVNLASRGVNLAITTVLKAETAIHSIYLISTHFIRNQPEILSKLIQCRHFFSN